MTKWTATRSLFFGGPDNALSIRGRRVRPINAVSNVELCEAETESAAPSGLEAGQEGFLLNEERERLLVAFPNGSRSSAGMNDLLHSKQFYLVRLSWDTFKRQFEIEGSF